MTSPEIVDATVLSPTALRQGGTEWRACTEPCEAVWLLGKLGHPGAIPALRRSLHHADVQVRLEAVWALARIGGAEALAGLEEALHDRDREVRGIASEAVTAIRRKLRVNRQGAATE